MPHLDTEVVDCSSDERSDVRHDPRDPEEVVERREDIIPVTSANNQGQEASEMASIFDISVRWLI